MGFRLWYASVLGVSPDEAYYYQWSKDLALVYPDHPPFVAWMMRLGTWALGETPLGLRIVAVLLSGAATVAVYLVGIEIRIGKTGAVLGACLSTLLLAPASAAVICTPDTFLGAFWIFAVWIALRLRKTRSPIWWYVFAVVFAGGVLSKYAALLMLPLLLVAVFARASSCSTLSSVHPAAAGFLALLLIAPHAVAEARAGFGAASFQTAHLVGLLPGAGDNSLLIAAGRIGEILGGQAGLLTPLVAFFLVLYLLRVRTDDAPVLKAAVLLPIVAALFAGLFTHPEQNWASLGHPLVGPTVVSALLHRYSKPEQKRRLRAWSLAVLCTVSIVLAVVHAHALYPFLPLLPEQDPTSRLHGWEALEALGDHMEHADAVVCDNYGLAAEFDWHLRSRLKKRVVTSPDRNPLPDFGNWMLLSQENDFGHAELQKNCRETVALSTILLKHPDGRAWDRIFVELGRDCD